MNILKFEKAVLFLLSALLLLVISLRAFGSEIVATAIITFVIFTATSIAALNMANARRKTNGRY